MKKETMNNSDKTILDILLYVLGFILLGLHILCGIQLHKSMERDKGTTLLIEQVIEIKRTIEFVAMKKEEITLNQLYEYFNGGYIKKDINGNIINYYSNTVVTKNDEGFMITVSNLPSRQCSYIAMNLYSYMNKKVMINNEKLSTSLSNFDPPETPKDYTGFFEKQTHVNKDKLEKTIDNACNSKNSISFYGIK